MQKTISMVIFIFVIVLITLITPQSSYGQVTRPGTYTWYTFDHVSSIYNLDIYTKWNESPANGAIFAAFQIGFQAGGGGYIGTQVNGTKKLVLFSLWDMEENSASAQPTGNCGRFGGEGTGAQCLIEYNWVEGREYRLRIWALDSDSEGERWIATIYDTSTQVDTMIGIIKLLNSKGHKGYGWLTPYNLITWLEYFSGPVQCTNQPYANVQWRGPYANNNTYTADNAVVTYASGCDANNVTSPGRPLALHEAGGATRQITAIHTNLWKTDIFLPMIVE